MLQKQQAQVQQTAGSIVFSILLLILLVIILVIQLTIIITYVMTMNGGRCIYKNESGNCLCRYTNKKSCDSLGGKFDSHFVCEDGVNLNGDCEVIRPFASSS